MDAVVRLVEEGQGTKKTSDAQAKKNWVTIDRQGFAGRFVPDQEVPDFEKDISPRARVDFEVWLRETTTTVVETELNTQLGEFTIKKHEIAPLQADIVNCHAFHTVFADIIDGDIVQCAEVVHTTNRMWVRLIGLGYDVQKWTEDQRLPEHNCIIPLAMCPAPWVQKILNPWMGTVLKNIELVSAKMLPDDNVVLLYGYMSNQPESPGEAEKKNIRKTLKEIIVYHHLQMFHVFNVISHGRRFYRTQVFASDPAYSLHDLTLNDGEYVGDEFRETTGQWDLPVEPSTSLVITRYFAGTEALGFELGSFQTFIPWYLLKGLLPACLLERYLFWQNPDDSLVGYVAPGNKQSVDKYVLNMKLVQKYGTSDSSGNGNSQAHAVICRIPVTDTAPTQAVVKSGGETGEHQTETFAKEISYSVDQSKPPMYLVNILHILSLGPQFSSSTEYSYLYDFVKMLLRLDSLSNILAWTLTDPSDSKNVLTIDVVELPRLHLTFEKQVDRDGVLRYYIVEQSGMFLADEHSRKETERLIAGLPHGIVVRNRENEHFVLLPATSKPSMIKVKGDKYSYKLSLNRMDESWIDSITTPYFIYPVHSSGGFMSAKSVSSTLYLILFRTLTRQFTEAFNLVETCVCDTEFTAQEREIYDAFGSIRDILSPDTHAMRLKLYFVTYGFSDVMPYPFDIRAEMLGYLTRLERISSSCRLNAEEEAFVLNRINAEVLNCDGRDYIFQNRLNLIKASFNLYLEKFSPRVENGVFKVVYPDMMKHSLIDGPIDLEVLDTSKPSFKTFIGKFAVVKYGRPEEMLGVPAVSFLMDIVREGGLDLRGKGNGLGFFFLYELMNGTLNVKILPDDHGHDVGSALSRLINDEALAAAQGLTGQCQANAIIRVMMEHRKISDSMPHFEDKRKLKLPSLAGLDIFQSHIKSASGFIKTHSSQLNISRLGYSVGGEYVPPAVINCSNMDAETGNTGTETGRSWITPKITDINCTTRFFFQDLPAILTGLSKTLTSADLRAFSSCPLEVIGLDRFVVCKTRSERNLVQVSGASPLHVLEHPSSRSHIARTSVARLEEDIRNFSVDENEASVPLMKSVGEASLSDVRAVETALGDLDTLQHKLDDLKCNDMAFVRVAIDEVVESANGRGRIGACRPNDMEILRHQFSQLGGKEATLVSMYDAYLCNRLKCPMCRGLISWYSALATTTIPGI